MKVKLCSTKLKYSPASYQRIIIESKIGCAKVTFFVYTLRTTNPSFDPLRCDTLSVSVQMK